MEDNVLYCMHTENMQHFTQKGDILIQDIVAMMQQC